VDLCCVLLAASALARVDCGLSDASLSRWKVRPDQPAAATLTLCERHSSAGLWSTLRFDFSLSVPSTEIQDFTFDGKQAREDL